jgi:hypothetical protein
MTQTYYVLAQASPTANVLTVVYTVPAATSTTISSIVICNTTSSATTFRISVEIAGAADAIPQYLYYDLPIANNDTFVATIGVTLATTDKLAVQAGVSNIAFNVFGVELS